LGNLMFQYASLRAIAEKYGARLILPASCKLRRGFMLDAIFVSDYLNDQLIRRYSADERHFPQALIRKEFTFLSQIIDKADGFLQEAKFEKIHAEAIVSGSKERDQVDIIQDFQGIIHNSSFSNPL
uniref:L-Fucosyltransferase n=1 Tax=Gongylonema pulchrum TaxID=637853 RepID=A0A183DWM5_9BILA